MPPIIQSISHQHAFLRAIFLILFAVVLYWQWQQSTQSPPRYYPVRITIPLAPGESKILGRTELAANQADPNHLRVRRAPNGQWLFANASETRAVEIIKNGDEQRLRTAPLSAPSRFAIAGQVFRITAISPYQLHFTDPAGQAWQYNGVNLQADPARSPRATCPVDSWLDLPKTMLKRQWHTLAPFWNRLAPASMASTAALELGGVLQCERRLALPQPVADLTAGSVRINLRDKGFFLSANAQSSRLVCLAPTPTGVCPPGQLLHEHETAIDGISKLVLGRTSFDVRLTDHALILLPRQRVAFSTEKTAIPGVTQEFARLDQWHWPFAFSPWALLLALLLSIAVLGTWLTLRKNAIALPRAFAWAAPVVSGVCVLAWATGGVGITMSQSLALATLAIATLTLMIHLKKPSLPTTQSFLLVTSLLVAALAWQAANLGTQLGLAWTLLLQALGLLAILLLPQTSRLAWFSFALAGLLFVMGAATQLALGLAGHDSGSLRFFQISHARIACGILLWFAMAQFVQLFPLALIKVQHLQRAIWLFASVALLALLAQALWGNEAGVAGFQPVELAKLALIIFSASLLASFLDWNHLRGLARLWLGLRLFCLIALLTLAVVLLLSLVHDFSPLVLLAFWIGGMLIGIALGSGRAMGLLLACAMLLAVSGVMWALTHDPAWHQQALAFDRFAVWLQPELYPHSGAQAQIAASVLEQGGWGGNPIAEPWRLPEVQNDMTPAYFLGRFGALGGALLLLLQTLYLACLLSLAWRTLAQAGVGDFRALWRARFMFFSLWGYAFFLAGHFAVSWGSNLQWLPVMGQPMPFLSSAGSLALFFLLPMQCLLLVPVTRPRQE